MILEFFIDCRPPTATAQHKSVRVRKAGLRMTPRGLVEKHRISFFETGKVREAREELTAHFTRHRPPTPLTGPLKLTVTWTSPWTVDKEKRRKRDELPAWVPKVTRPDGDNLAKQLKDVLTKLGFWWDDAHVSAEYYRRGHGDRPGIHVRIEPYDSDYTPPEDDPVAEVVL